MALVASRGEKTLVELAEQYGVHVNQIGQWRLELLERAAEVFTTATEKRDAGPDLKALHAKIGQQVLEIEWKGHSRMAIGGGRGAAGGDHPLRRSRDHEHRPGHPIHGGELHRRVESARHPDQHGRQGLLARQRLRGAAVKVGRVRACLPACLRHVVGSAHADRGLPRLLQPPALAQQHRPPNVGRGILQPAAETGGVTRRATHLEISKNCPTARGHF